MIGNVPLSLTGVVHGMVKLGGKPAPNVRVRLTPVPFDLCFIDVDYNKTLRQRPDYVDAYTDEKGVWTARVLAPGENVFPADAKWHAHAALNGYKSTVVTKAASRDSETDFGDLVLTDSAASAAPGDLGPLTARVEALENAPKPEGLTEDQKQSLAKIPDNIRRIAALESKPAVDLQPLTDRVVALENKPAGGALVLQANAPVPPGTPAGTVIVRV